MKPSTAKVYALLKSRPEGITAMDALSNNCGDSLAQRIHELRAEGHVIGYRWEETYNGARVKRYRLEAPRPVPTRGVQESFADWSQGELQEAFGK